MKREPVGQKKIKSLFNVSLKKGTLGHCYVLEGEKGMGKSTLAKYLAKMIVCENHTACGKCKGCLMADGETHPDILYVLPEPDKKNIGVPIIRDMIQQVYIRPYEASKKVIIINNFEMASPQAQNALLKVIEEPPEYAVFIFTVASEKELLDTVKSRCCMLKLQPYTKEEIVYFLENYTDALGEKLEFAAAYCNGNTGKGKEIAENQEFTLLRKIVFDAFIEFIDRKNILPLSEVLKKDDKGKANDVFDCMLSFLRDIVGYKIGLETGVSTLIILTKLKPQAGK